ncbi:MAG: LptF/LptG family permease [Chitinophagaceae bacterium]|nr:LptF/LptG family permease [Chitinophagaceae bacterium]
MFKKLDKLIIKAFLGPFAATFFIVLLVLIMQFFWLYIDDFVGKGIATGVIFEFILYQSAVLVPLALPLSILLSSLMTFGNLGESFELVAIKSAGISLLRFMRPIFVVSSVIAIMAFLFANYVIPVANLKARTLLGDIVFAKPAFDLKEGVFYDKIPNYAIKIGTKEKNDSVVKDIIIYEQDNQLQDNFIIAKSGVMRVSKNKRFLEFNLKDGWRYQERGNAYGGNQNTEFIRIGFKELQKQFDLSSLGFSNRTADSLNKNNAKMFSMRQLEVSIDSLEKDLQHEEARGAEGLFNQFYFAKMPDSSRQKLSAANIQLTKKDFASMLPDSARSIIDQKLAAIVSTLIPSVESLQTILHDKERNIREHKIEWHRKIVLSLACIILFLIGAPLGAIIRKGGLGTPLIFAIVFFMLFYFSSTVGEKFAKENTMSPFGGMWLASFVLIPIGIFLTWKAMRDSQLFNKEFYNRLGQAIKRFFSSHKGVSKT